MRKTPLSVVLAAVEGRWDRRRRDQERQAWHEAERSSGRKARRLTGESNSRTPRALDARERHAIALHGLGRFAEAEAEFAAVAGARAATLSGEHADTLRAARWRGAALQALGRLTEAEPVLRAAWEGGCRQLGAGHKDAINAGFLHAEVLWRLDRAAEAESEYRVLAELAATARGSDSAQARRAGAARVVCSCGSAGSPRPRRCRGNWSIRSPTGRTWIAVRPWASGERARRRCARTGRQRRPRRCTGMSYRE